MSEKSNRPTAFRDKSVENIAETVDIRKVILGMRRKFWLVVACGALCAALAGAVSFVLLNRYEAEVLLLYRDDAKRDEIPGGYGLSAFSLPTTVAMIQLPGHFKAVKSILGLELEADSLAGMISVESPSRNTDIIRVKARADSEGLTIDVVNTLASVAVKHSQDIRRSELQRARDYFVSEKESAETRLTRQISEIAAFKKEHDFLEMDINQLGAVRNLEEAEAGVRKARIQYQSLLVEFENLRREVARIPDHVVKLAREDNPMKERIAQTEMALLRARTRYAPDNPKVKILQDELDQLQSLISSDTRKETHEKVYEKNPLKEELNLELVRLQGKVRSAQKVKEESEARLVELHEDLTSLPEEQMAFAKLLGDKVRIEGEIKELDEALRATQMFMSVGKGDIELYQLADAARPYESRLLEFLPTVGFVSGLGLGIFLVFLLEMSDRKLRTAKQLGNAYTPPCLQVIPELPRLTKANSEESTLYFIRNISDRLSLLSEQGGNKSILFSSAKQYEGKSTIAYHFAKYHHRLGQKVVFVGFDYKQCQFVENQGEGHTVDDYLRGTASLDDIIRSGAPDTISIKEDAGLKELVRSAAMDSLWTELSHRYDLIVLDGPAILEDSYGVNLARRADVNIYVVGSSLIAQKIVDTGLQELESNGVVPQGLVLNRVSKTYIDDVRIRQERKRISRRWWKDLFSSKKEQQSEKTAV